MTHKIVSHPFKRAFLCACWCWLLLVVAAQNVASQNSAHVLEFPWMRQTITSEYNMDLNLEPNAWLVEATIGNPEVLCDGPWTVSYRLFPAGGTVKAPSTWPQGSSSIRAKARPNWVSWGTNDIKTELTTIGTSPTACKASSVKVTLVVFCDGCIGLVTEVTFLRSSKTDASPGGPRALVPLYATEIASTNELHEEKKLALFERRPLAITHKNSPNPALISLTGRAQVQLNVAPSKDGYPLTAVFTFLAREGAYIREFIPNPQSFRSLPVAGSHTYLDPAGQYAIASIDTLYPGNESQAPASHDYVIDVNCDACATEGASLHFEPKSLSWTNIQLMKSIQTVAASIRESGNTTLNATSIADPSPSSFPTDVSSHWRLTGLLKNPQILCDDEIQLAYTFQLNPDAITSMSWDINGTRFPARPKNRSHQQVVTWTPLAATPLAEKICNHSEAALILALDIVCNNCTAPTSRHFVVSPVNPISPTHKQPSVVKEILSAILKPNTEMQLVHFATQVKDATLICSRQGFHAIYRFTEGPETLRTPSLTARSSLGSDLGVMPVGTCVGTGPLVCAFKVFSLATDDKECKNSHIDLFFSARYASSTKPEVEGSLEMNAPLSAN